MDVDVKIATDKLFEMCTAIDKSGKYNLENAVIKDIYAFICNISKENADERFDYFSKLYLDGKYRAEEYKNIIINKIPESLEKFQEIEKDRPFGIDIKPSAVLISFFMKLGSFYKINSANRREIDSAEFMDIISEMNDMVKSAEGKVIPLEAKEGKAEKKADTINESEEPQESLEELLEQLNSLIGLSGVKNQVNQLINLIKVQKKGEEFGENVMPLSLHLVFYGNPGTGKTTVARLLAKIYRSLGVLSKGQLVEVDRGGLVAGYVGQTATKTQDAIERAMGGILFIDEAYALTHGKGENDFGQEAVDTILKAMEDNRDDFIVIVAGYPDLMKEFVASNPGLESRFNQYINFEDYSVDELIQIFNMRCRERNLTLGDGCDDYLTRHFTDMYNNRSENYANGRDVRNYFENVIKARADRLAPILDDISKEEYLKIILKDLEEADRLKSSI